jgi:hypothetical protein
MLRVWMDSTVSFVVEFAFVGQMHTDEESKSFLDEGLESSFCAEDEDT